MRRLKASNRQGGKQAESNVTVALGNEKARLKGIRSDCRHLKAVLVGRGVWETDGLDGLSAETHLPSVRAMCSSGIVSTSTPTLYIHKCGTAAYKSERRKLHCDRMEERGRIRGTTVYTVQNSPRGREWEKNKTFGCNPLVQLPSARFMSKTTGTTLGKGQGLKAAHNTDTHTHT